MRTTREYSREQIEASLAALAGNQGSFGRTSKALGIPEATLRSWARARERKTSTKAQEQKKPLDVLLSKLAAKLLSVVRLNAREMTGPQAAIALGICLDKLVVLRTSGVLDKAADTGLGSKTEAELRAEMAHHDSIIREGELAEQGGQIAGARPTGDVVAPSIEPVGPSIPPSPLPSAEQNPHRQGA